MFASIHGVDQVPVFPKHVYCGVFHPDWLSTIPGAVYSFSAGWTRAAGSSQKGGGGSIANGYVLVVENIF